MARFTSGLPAICRAVLTSTEKDSLTGSTKRYGLKMLVYYEHYDDIRTAIQREKTIKHGPRAWKVRLIHGMNPEWKDLYEALF
jgi:putative endonuclease